MDSSRPNVVLICTDQLRFDALGCNGSPVARTPNIDRIAADGLTFRNHVTPCQICAPSRASLFSGLYPRHHGLTRNGIALDPALELLPHAMMDAGMRTHGVGKFHFQPILAPASYGMPESNAFWALPESADWRGPFHGFRTVDFVIGESFTSVRGGHYARWLERHHPEVAPLYLPDHSLDEVPDEMDEVWRSAVPHALHYNRWIADRAVDFLRDAAGDAPFFAFISFPDPHHPFSPPAPYCDRFDPERMPAPARVPGELDAMPDYIADEIWVDGPQGRISYKEFLDAGEFAIEQGTWQRTDGFSERSVRRIIAYTHAMVHMIDDCVGRVLDALDELGATHDTYVVFTSDHGELLGDHGLIRKGPMPYRQLLRIPFVVRGPDVTKGGSVDALTSHLDVKATFAELLGLEADPGDGLSMTALLGGGGARIRDHTFAEYHPRAVGKQYNQSIVTDDVRLTLYPRAPDEGWGELFDHRTDPGEHRNLYTDPARAHQIESLRSRMGEHFPPMPEVPGRVLGFY